MEKHWLEKWRHSWPQLHKCLSWFTKSMEGCREKIYLIWAQLLWYLSLNKQKKNLNMQGNHCEPLTQSCCQMSFLKGQRCVCHSYPVQHTSCASCCWLHGPGTCRTDGSATSRKRATECLALYHTIWKKEEKKIKVDITLFHANIKHNSREASTVYWS